jgi:hypothetical protein
MKHDFSFLFRHVDINNLGQHDLYNGFLRKEGLVEEFEDWQENNPGAVPVGICEECRSECGNFVYVAMVYEDEEGRRYFVHVPHTWIAQARVYDQGPEAMEDARCLELFGITGRERANALEELAKAVPAQLAEKSAGTTEPEPAKEPEAAKEPEPQEPSRKVAHLKFSVDALHLIEDLIDDGQAAGISIGLGLLHGLLQSVAKRATELDDPELHLLMIRMRLYDIPADELEKTEAELRERMNARKAEQESR